MCAEIAHACFVHHSTWGKLRCCLCLFGYAISAFDTCRPALNIYNWAQAALRGLVTVEDTLSGSVHDYIQAYKQKDLAQVLISWPVLLDFA